MTFSVDTEYYGGDLASLLYYNPYIDEIIDYRICNRDDYDAFSDITRAGMSEEIRSMRPGSPTPVPPNRIDLFANAARVPLYGQTRPIYVMTEEEREWGKAFVQKAIDRMNPTALIGIHLRSNDPKRTWPKDKVREFIKLCQKKNFHTFLFGWGDSSEDWQYNMSTQVFDHNARVAASVLEHLDLLVCPDSAWLHVGGALNKKMVVTFGSMPPACRINHYNNAVAVVNEQMPCLGCIYNDCPRPYVCMDSIQASKVMSAVEKKLMDPLVDNQADSASDVVVYPGSQVKAVIQTFEM
jgi:hypothetical protein